MKKTLPLLAVLVLGACGGTGTSTDSVAAPDTTQAAVQPTNPSAKIAGPVTIDVTVGTDSGKERVEQVVLGTEVTLNIVNPSADDEFHLHGYDLSTGETVKGATASISFTADKAGEFAVESHVTEELILTVVVQ